MSMQALTRSMQADLNRICFSGSGRWGGAGGQAVQHLRWDERGTEIEAKDWRGRERERKR